MRNLHPRGARTGLGACVLAISALLAGTACGAGSSTAGGRTASTAATARPGAVASGLPDDRAAAEARQGLRRLEDSHRGRIGAYALDTGTGRSIGYRSDERFASNSTFKAILCGAVLDRARRTDPGLMDRTLRWTEDEVVAHSPVTGRRENVDNGMTAAQLCHATVTTSDNTAANVLLEQLGGPPGMTRYYRSLGDPVGRLDHWEPALNDWRPGEQRDTVTPGSMARDLHELTLGSALVPEDRRRLIGWMRANTTGGERIRAGLPEDWTVGDKTGTGGAYAPAGDIAIAWPPSGAPLIIAIYTHRNSADGEVDDRVIATAASLLARGLGKVP